MPICTTTALQSYPVEAYTHTHTHTQSNPYVRVCEHVYRMHTYTPPSIYERYCVGDRATSLKLRQTNLSGLMNVVLGHVSLVCVWRMLSIGL